MHFRCSYYQIENSQISWWCFDGCCCRSLCKWHARAVDLGSGRNSGDPVTVTNQFLWWRSKFLFILEVMQKKQRYLALRLIFFAQARQGRHWKATQISKLVEVVVVAYHHAHVITLAWEVTNALQGPSCWVQTVQYGIVWPPGESATSPEAISPRACCTCLCSHWWAILRMIARLFGKALKQQLT